ncbi:MAG TPA: hypothetical protein VFE99_08110 [Agromyces sp.]|nr:hypothetical protein [Agromyces sp.]
MPDLDTRPAPPGATRSPAIDLRHGNTRGAAPVFVHQSKSRGRRIPLQGEYALSTSGWAHAAERHRSQQVLDRGVDPNDPKHFRQLERFVSLIG